MLLQIHLGGDETPFLSAFGRAWGAKAMERYAFRQLSCRAAAIWARNLGLPTVKFIDQWSEIWEQSMKGSKRGWVRSKKQTCRRGRLKDMLDALIGWNVVAQTLTKISIGADM